MRAERLCAIARFLGHAQHAGSRHGAQRCRCGPVAGVAARAGAGAGQAAPAMAVAVCARVELVGHLQQVRCAVVQQLVHVDDLALAVAATTGRAWRRRDREAGLSVIAAAATTAHTADAAAAVVARPLPATNHATSATSSSQPWRRVVHVAGLIDKLVVHHRVVVCRLFLRGGLQQRNLHARLARGLRVLAISIAISIANAAIATIAGGGCGCGAVAFACRGGKGGERLLAERAAVASHGRACSRVVVAAVAAAAADARAHAFDKAQAEAAQRQLAVHAEAVATQQVVAGEEHLVVCADAALADVAEEAGRAADNMPALGVGGRRVDAALEARRVLLGRRLRRLRRLRLLLLLLCLGALRQRALPRRQQVQNRRAGASACMAAACLVSGGRCRGTLCERLAGPATDSHATRRARHRLEDARRRLFDVCVCLDWQCAALVCCTKPKPWVVICLLACA
eukprot:m.14456 g.14456  ORF g.14456 m.14456 type:complete len:456 (-) comp7133_c0_seq1:44-1411(-)